MQRILTGLICILLLVGSLRSQEVHITPRKPLVTVPEVANSWAQEPSSFLRITLGKPIWESIKECPKSGLTEHYSWSNVSFACYEPIADFFVVHNISGFTKVFVTEVSGRVESVAAEYPERSGGDVARALSEKFGPPHYTAEEKVRTQAGIEYSRITSKWSGLLVTITNESLGSDINHGRVNCFSSKYEKYLLEKSKTRSSSYKEKF